MRQYTAVSFAESSADMTPLQGKANGLAQRRKYRTAQLRNAGHNCSREVRYLRAGTQDAATEKYPRLCTGAEEASAAFVLLEETMVARPKLWFRTPARRWVSAHRKLARLSTELRATSITIVLTSRRKTV
jgi:hypothetical protein